MTPNDLEQIMTCVVMGVEVAKELKNLFKPHRSTTRKRKHIRRYRK